MPVRIFVQIVLFALFALAMGCQREPLPQLITVSDFAPREAELGDRLEVTGSGFPQGRTAHIAFRGALYRPGEATTTGAAIATEALVTSSQKIELLLTDALQERFCGPGDRAVHTTFHGEIEVSFVAIAPGAPPIAGTLHDVTIDLLPPATHRLAEDRRAREADRTLAFMGISGSIASGGLLVREVVPGSRAERAGVVAGDLVTSFDHVRISSLADVASGSSRVALLGIRRGESAKEEIKEVPIDGLRDLPPGELLGAALVLSAAFVFLLFFVTPAGGPFARAELMLASRLRGDRPKRHARRLIALATAALFGQDRAPKDPYRRAIPLLVLFGISAAFAVMPFGQYLIAADLDVGALFIVGALTLLASGLASAGSMLDRMRTAARILSAEVPAALAIAAIVLLTGSLRVQEIIRAQGGWPWEFWAFRSPVALLLFFLYFATRLGTISTEDGTSPATEGSADVLSTRRPSPERGLHQERQASPRVAERASALVSSGIAATLFLGGWRLPYVSMTDQDARVGLQILGAVVLLVKMWGLAVAVLFVRWLLPSISIVEMTRTSVRWLVPAAALAFALAIGWVYLSPSQTLETAIGVGLFGFFALGSIRLAHRVRFAARRPEPHLDPFV